MLEVKIRPLQIEDAYTSFKWRNDAEVWKFTGSKPNKKISLNDELAWISKVIKDLSARRFAIIVDSVYVGNVQITDLTDTKGQIQIFIGNKEYWGKGIASLAIGLVADYAQNELNLLQVYVEVNPLNQASMKACLKNGFVKQSGTNFLIKKLHG